MSGPVICFGQQPCGFFPRRFLYAKFQTARRLQGSRLSPLGALQVKGRREPHDAFVLHGFEDDDD